MTMTWAPEAAPKAADEAIAGEPHPEVVEAAVARDITSVVHFTRTTGLKGIAGSGCVKARRDLPSDDLVKYVYSENAADRSRDFSWLGYINLSITAINPSMFESSRGWHPNDEWVILRFSPDILGDPGVVFCTTNNAYPVAHRAEGLPGFEQMFAPAVPWGKFGSTVTRSGKPDSRTTCPQAEALYPFELELDRLHTITVGDDDTYETTYAILSNFDINPNIELDPGAFA
ncbi:MAG: DarT ssDNA thymidine ADP-ribosyltransferase family protein [Microthrixaceae bacterium]